LDKVVGKFNDLFSLYSLPNLVWKNMQVCDFKSWLFEDKIGNL